MVNKNNFIANLLREGSLGSGEIIKRDNFERFVRKVTTGEPFETTPQGANKFGPNVVVAVHPDDLNILNQMLQTGDTEQQKAAAAKIKMFTPDGQKVGWGDLQKNADWGSSGGSGGGAAKTAVQEPTTAVAIAIASSLGRNIELTDLTAKNMRAVSRMVSISASIPDMVELSQDKGWGATFVNSANALLTTFPQTGGLTYHHQSRWVQAFNKAYNTANKADGSYFSKLDKWNPSDIWVVHPSLPLPAEKDYKSIAALNNWLNAMFDTGAVFGISLKKAPKQATAKLMNKASSPEDIIDLTVKELVVSKTNKLFASNDSYVIFQESEETFLASLLNEKDSEIQYRQFNTDQGVQGEIKGKQASHGKIGFGPTNKVLIRMGMKPMEMQRDIQRRMRTPEGKLGVVNDIIRMAKDVTTNIRDEDEKTLKQLVKKISNSHLAAKYQAVQLMWTLNQHPDKQKAFMDEAYGYAASRSELSSVYIKIS